MQISPSMHDDLQNVAVDSEQTPQVTLNHRPASPLFAHQAHLSVNLEVEPHKRYFLFLLEVETEADQTVV